MDDIGLGMVVRTARVKRGWRQRDLAKAVGISDAVISRLERGHIDGITVGTIRAIAGALDIRVELVPKSRSANLDRQLRAKHAALAEAVIRWLAGFPGWIARPEASFSIYGERGVIDLLAWHPGRRALVIIELKTAVVDVGELLATLDRKVRLARVIARDIGWDPLTVSVLLIIAEGPTNRRRVAAHAATFAASFPDRIVAVRRLLQGSLSEVRALMFFSDQRHGQIVQRLDHRERVTLPRNARNASRPNVDPEQRGAPRPDSETVPTILTNRTGRSSI